MVSWTVSLSVSAYNDKRWYVSPALRIAALSLISGMKVDAGGIRLKMLREVIRPNVTPGGVFCVQSYCIVTGEIGV